MDVAKLISPAPAEPQEGEAFYLSEVGAAREMPGAEQNPAASRAATKLPLLSFIVVNYNYGRFLETCVVSIMEQNYPNIECLIVDNASTDISVSVIDSLEQRYPALQVLRNSTNLGQNGACCLGLARTRGSFVAFIDADDYLFPFYAATHIRAHLVLRGGIGFTSGDMVQMVDDTIVRGNYIDPSWVQGWIVPPSKFGLNDIRDISAAVGTDFLESPEFAAKVQVLSGNFIDWAWAPTSGNVYRRDALSLLADNPRLIDLKFATDAYYNFTLNAWIGSALIEKSLAVYRIHSANNFCKRATIQAVLTFNRDTDDGPRAAFFALEYITSEFDKFLALFGNVDILLATLKILKKRANRYNNNFFEKYLLAYTKRYFTYVVRGLKGRFAGSSVLERQARERDRDGRAP